MFSIANGVQHDGRLPFWKPASVFAHYVRIVIVLAIGEINILLLLRVTTLLTHFLDIWSSSSAEQVQATADGVSTVLL